MSRAHSDFRMSDLVAVVDTREQRPLDLEIQTVVGTLPTADYSVRGLENLIAIERKSLPDLVSCVGVNRERFEREIQRLQAYEVRALVVEASWASIELGQYRSQVAPQAVIGSLYSWMARGITVVMAGDRPAAAKAVSRILYAAARERWRQLQSFYESLKLVGGDA